MEWQGQEKKNPAEQKESFLFLLITNVLLKIKIGSSAEALAAHTGRHKQEEDSWIFPCFLSDEWRPCGVSENFSGTFGLLLLLTA